MSFLSILMSKCNMYCSWTWNSAGRGPTCQLNSVELLQLYILPLGGKNYLKQVQDMKGWLQYSQKVLCYRHNKLYLPHLSHVDRVALAVRIVFSNFTYTSWTKGFSNVGSSPSSIQILSIPFIIIISHIKYMSSVKTFLRKRLTCERWGGLVETPGPNQAVVSEKWQIYDLTFISSQRW